MLIGDGGVFIWICGRARARAGFVFRAGGREQSVS